MSQLLHQRRPAIPRPVFLRILALCFAFVSTAARADFVPRNNAIDVDGNGADDIKVEECTDCGSEPNRLVHVNGSGSLRSYSSSSWADTDCDDALGATYVSSGPFLPSIGEVILVTSGGAHFGKLRYIGPNSGPPTAGMGLEWQSMTCTLPGAPTTNFIYATYDLLAYFVDISSNSPTYWHWRLGDGNTRSGYSPTVFHVYECFPAYPVGWWAHVCLETSNAGGDGTPHADCLADPANPAACCKNVWSWPVPSTIYPSPGFVDLDADGVADFQVLDAPECPEVANKLRPLGNATWAVATSTEPYWDIGLEDVPMVVDGISDFCPNTADPWNTHIFHASNSIVKAWFPANKDSSPTACIPAGGAPFVRIASGILFTDCPASVQDIDAEYANDAVPAGGSEHHEACVTLTYGPNYEIHGRVTAIAGLEILFENGFAVMGSGEFSSQLGW